MGLESTLERWWMRWVDLEPGIPYWNPYVASIVLFLGVIVALNLIRLLLAARRRARPTGFTFARIRAERDKQARIRARAARND